MKIGISIGITQISAGPRYSLSMIFPPELSVDGSSVWTITPGVYSNPDFKLLTATYKLFRNGVETAFSPVSDGNGNLTFTDATTNAEFFVVERVTASGTSPATHPSNAVYVAGSPSYTNIPDASWTATEALADADTRKTLATVSYAPAASRRFSVYRGSTLPPDDPTGVSVADMSGSGSSWSWTSSGQASLGQTQYVRIMERDTATDTNRRWCSNVKTFTASNVPGAPTVSIATGAGQGLINVTITNGAATNGRALTRYEYSIDGGSWLTLAGGTAVGLHVISGLTPVTAYGVRIRGVNANGNGTATASQTATSGAVAQVPAALVADTDWTLVDSPSTGGDKLTLTLVNLPSDGGSALTDIKYTINGGSPISFGLTPTSIQITSDTPELPTSVVIYAQNAVGDATGSSLTKTPTKTTAAATTAYFGAATPSGTGGWKPTTALGDEIALTGIVSQTGMTRTWQVSGGVLTANGTPDVDNGKSLTVATADGNITVTISTIANAKSCGTSLELNTALGTSSSVPYQLLMRGGRSYDMLGPSDTSTSSIFANRNFASTARRTVTTHPNDIKKWITTNWKHNFSGTANLTIKNCLSGSGAKNAGKMWCQTGSVDGVYFESVDVICPAVPDASLYDTADWPTGYTGPAAWCFDFPSATNMQWRDCLGENVWVFIHTATTGALRIINCRCDRYYFDNLRTVGTGDAVPKFIDDLSWFGSFSNNNEKIDEIDPSTGKPYLQPHTDGIQNISGTVRFMVIRGTKGVPGNYRSPTRSKPSGFQTNGEHRQCVIFNGLVLNSNSVWGYNPGNSFKNVIANSAFVCTNNGSTQIRLGVDVAGYRGRGRHVVTGTYARNLNNVSLEYNGGDETADRINLYSNRKFTNNIAVTSGTGSTTDFSDNFTGPGTNATLTLENLLTQMTPKVGSDAATIGVGPLDTSGNYRTMEWPPLPGNAPTLYDSGSDVIIAPSPSKNSFLSDIPGMVMPTTWGYRYRNADGTNWTEVTGLTGATATLVAPNKTGLKVEAWWIGANGLEGPVSDPQTTITASSPLTNTALPTLSRTNGSVSLNAAGTWTPSPDSRTYTKTINSSTTSWDGATPFTVAPGDTYSITETAVKTGYSSTSANSATGSYPILTLTAAPVIQISGTTVSLVSGPTWDVSPDSVTYTKTVAGTETSWDGSSNITISSGQSCFVKATPTKSGYFVDNAATQSNTVTASASSYPTVKQEGSGQNANNSTNTNSFTVSAYASRAVGDTLMYVVGIDGAPTVTPSAGFTLKSEVQSANGSGGQKALVFTRTADGTSADDLGVTLSASEQWYARRWCFDGSVNVSVATPHNVSGNQTPNPPNLDLGSSKAAYWAIATVYSPSAGNYSTANMSSGYTGIGSASSQAAGAGVGICAASKQATAQSDNPAAYGATTWEPITYTIGVYV